MADDDRKGSGGGGWWPEGEPPDAGSKPKRTEGEGASRPPRGLASKGRPRPSGRYSWFVGLAFVALVLVALLNLVNDDDTGILVDPGTPLAGFAVPDALAGVDADANVAQDDCESSRNPCPDDQRRTPACEIQVPGAIRVCDLFDKPLAISFWFTRGGDCIPSQDAFDRVASRFAGRDNFHSINVRDDPDTVAGIVRDRGWDVPVGIDRDGAVSNLYRVGVCPTIFLAYPGGILYQERIRPGNYDSAELSELVGGLLKATRERAEQVR
jgi:hypothetical protein